MTDTTRTSSQTELAAGNLFRIMTELGQAHEDVALLERLKGAQERVKRLTAEHDTAVTDQEAALTAKATATEEARFAGLSDITVVDKTPGEGPLSAVFMIHYKQMAWDMDLHATVAKPHTVQGFRALPPTVFTYLLERHPSKIPARIMALAPGNPHAAFDRYFLGLRMGYIKGGLA